MKKPLINHPKDVLKNVKYGTLDVDILIKRLTQGGVINIKMEIPENIVIQHLVTGDM